MQWCFKAQGALDPARQGQGQGEGADLDPSQHHEPHKEYELAQQQHPHLSRRHLVSVHCVCLQIREAS